MPIPHAFEPGTRAALTAVLLLTAAAPGCGGGEDPGAAAARIDVDPCRLLTNEEISEQLFLSLPEDERSGWTTSEFDITASEPELGVTRQCEYRFQSRFAAGGGPAWQSDFDIMVFPSTAIGLPEEQRRPIVGGGPDMFGEPGTAGAHYVVKGDLAASLHRFPGRTGASEPDAGRAVLLRRIAERLP